jgi:hypothetical protein
LAFAVAASIARSQLHRIAGRDLLYSRRSPDGVLANPFDAMRTYVMFGIGHALVIGIGGMLELGASTATVIGVFIGLSLWPAALAVVLHVLHARRLDTEVPLAEDRGLEGASILMTVLGACGVLSTGAILLAVRALPSRHLQHGWGAMLVVVFILLLVRSSLHLRAGLSGLREPSFDRPSELTTRYASAANAKDTRTALAALGEARKPTAVASAAAPPAANATTMDSASFLSNIPDTRAVTPVKATTGAELKTAFTEENSREQERAREKHSSRKAQPLLPFAEARSKRPLYDWSSYEPPRPSFLGTRVYNPVPLEEVGVFLQRNVLREWTCADGRQQIGDQRIELLRVAADRVRGAGP